jgi:PAS domain S-box-containing protein
MSASHSRELERSAVPPGMVTDISERLPDRTSRRAVLTVLAVSTAVFAATVPLAKQPLAPTHWFIPLVQSVLIVNDLITAVLLLGQLRLTRRMPLLVLAGGYLYAALMAGIHLLTFPGVFAPGGLLGAGAQSTGYLHVFWHLGLPFAVMAYVLARKRGDWGAMRLHLAVPLMIGTVGALALALAALATLGNDLLPPMLEAHRYSSEFNIGRYGQWAVTACAIAVLWRSRPRSVLDLWLIVMLCNSFFEIALVAIFNAGRYDVGFYAGRVFAVLSSFTVLVMLLAEHGKLHRELANTDAVRASEERYRRLADMIPQHVWVTESDGYHTYFSRSWYEFTGSAPGDSDGEGWLAWLHPEDRERSLRTWHKSLATGEPYSVEYRFRGADGQYHWFIGQAAPLRNSDGDVVQWFGTLTDIEERKQHEAERERLLAAERAARAEADRRRAELERATEGRVRLMRGFSHDLRSPLFAADMSAALLELGRLDDKQREAVRRIRRGIKTSVRLVDDLLELAHAEAGQVDLRPTLLEVRDVARDIVEEFQAQAASVGLELVLEVPAGVKVHADPMRVRQILVNLVSNAVKYAPQGATSVRATAPRGGPSGPVAVSVADSGPGIPADKHELVFEEYARLDAAQQGSGIGLAISRRIARLMGGDLTLESEPGSGSVFTLWLPAGAQAPSEPERNDSPRGKTRQEVS